MPKVKVNLIDVSLVGANNSIVAASVKHGMGEDNHRTPALIEYVRNQNDWDGITVFTDQMMDEIPNVSSKIKVAIIMEGWLIYPKAYHDVIKYEDELDYIFTYHPDLLGRNPDKYKFMAADTVSVETDGIKIHEKSKLLTMMYSDKATLPGHQVRQHLANSYFPSIDVTVKADMFGKGCDKHVKLKSDGIKDYMFSIEVENSFLPGYFTEKILDCFATGTVPIYCGAPNIADYFDPDGILTFSGDIELGEILNKLSPELYNKMAGPIKNNYEQYYRKP